MTRYQVAVNTVERAIEELRKAGIVETLQGAGMFVCEPPSTVHSPEFTALMEHLAGIDNQVRQLADRVDELEKLMRGGQSWASPNGQPDPSRSGPDFPGTPLMPRALPRRRSWRVTDTPGDSRAAAG